MLKPKLAVHKFTSCDGCQLALLNAGEALLSLSEQMEIIHFAEAGMLNPDAKVDIALIEGSISTPGEIKKIKHIREQSSYLISIGACATSGGLQALRQFANHAQWLSSVYASPEHLSSLSTSTAIAAHVKVDFELWGCPINTKQLLEVLAALVQGSAPHQPKDAVCVECKRLGHICVLVTGKQACMGPVTQTGCGALCPSVGRACYGCYGPKERPNTAALGKQFEVLGQSKKQISNAFLHINNQAPAFNEAGLSFKGIKIVKG